MNETILDATLRMAQSLPKGVTVKSVCNAAGVTTRWLAYLKAGEIENPGFNRVKRLHDVLKDRSGKNA